MMAWPSRSKSVPVKLSLTLVTAVALALFSSSDTVAATRLGASFCAATVRVTVCVALGSAPSFATTVMERLDVVGVSLVSLYRMPCRIVWYTAVEAAPVSESTPVPAV